MTLEDGRFALVVNCWRNLGTVQTPFDLKFRCLERIERAMGSKISIDVGFLPGSLKNDFELDISSDAQLPKKADQELAVELYRRACPYTAVASDHNIIVMD